MMQESIGRRRILIGIVVILSLVGGTFSGWRVATAQYYAGLFGEAPYAELTGIGEALHRSYMGPSSIYVHIFADIARFDTPENAALGLETINAYYLDAFARDASPLAFEPVDVETTVPGTHAYTAVLDLGYADTPPYGEGTLLQAQDDFYVYTVVAVDYYGGVLDNVEDKVSLAAAVAMLEAMASIPAGPATPAASPDEGPVSGIWAKFPAQEDEVLQQYGITDSSDVVAYAPEPPAPLPDVVVATYGEVEGLVSVVARTYGVMDSTSEEVQDAPVAHVELAAFNEAASAEPAFTSAATTSLGGLGLDGLGLEETNADVAADEAVAWAGQVESEGEQFGIAVIASRSGLYVVTVAVITTGDEDALAGAEDLTDAVMGAEAGAGAETYDAAGASSGGVWDKVPAAGADVLNGMEPVEDAVYYPEPEDGL
jgi:hypothetical protein